MAVGIFWDLSDPKIPTRQSRKQASDNQVVACAIHAISKMQHPAAGDSVAWQRVTWQRERMDSFHAIRLAVEIFFGSSDQKNFNYAKVDEQIQGTGQLCTWQHGSSSARPRGGFAPGKRSAISVPRSASRDKCLAIDQADKKNPGTDQRVGVVGG